MHHSTTRATTFPLLPRFFLLLNFSVSHTGWLSKLQIFPNAYTHTHSLTYMSFGMQIPFYAAGFIGSTSERTEILTVRVQSNSSTVRD